MYLFFITVRFMELTIPKYKKLNILDMSLFDAASYSFNLAFAMLSLAVWLLIMHAVGKLIIITVLWEIYGYIPIYIVIMLLNNRNQKKLCEYSQLRHTFCDIDDKQVVVSFLCWMVFCCSFLFVTMYFHWSIQ